MSPHLFNLNHRNSSYACIIVFFLVRVLVKARFLDSQATDPKSQTVLLTTADEQTYVENFSSLSAIAAEKYETDGQTDERTDGRTTQRFQ
jgi:hypothetical protein